MEFRPRSGDKHGPKPLNNTIFCYKYVKKYYLCKYCKYGTYVLSNATGATECHTCPVNAECNGGTDIKLPEGTVWNITNNYK